MKTKAKSKFTYKPTEDGMWGVFVKGRRKPVGKRMADNEAEIKKWWEGFFAKQFDREMYIPENIKVKRSTMTLREIIAGIVGIEADELKLPAQWAAKAGKKVVMSEIDPEETDILNEHNVKIVAAGSLKGKATIFVMVDN